MIKITPHNCEAWMLDYFEGRLSAKQSSELMAFLDAHPEWKTEFEAFGEQDEVMEITPENSPNESSDLQSALLQKSRDEDLIALLEGQLNAKDTSHLLNELEHDEKLAGDFALYQLTKVKPDFNIQYPHKSKLRKSAPVRVLMLRYTAVAAMLFGAVLGGWLYFHPLTTNTKRIVATSSTERVPAAADQNATSIENDRNETDLEGNSKSTQNSDVTLLADNETGNTGATESKDQQNTATSTPHKANHIAEVPDDPRQEMQIDAMDIRKVTNISLASAVKTAPLIITNSSVQSSDPNWLTEEINTGLGGMLANFGQNVIERLKSAAGNNVVIEQEEAPEDELYTSTFRLGSLEIYRSRIKKE